MIHRPIVPSAVFWTALVALASLMSISSPHPPRTGDASGGGGGLATQCAVFMNIYPLHTWGYRKPLITYRFHLPEICLKFKKLNTPTPVASYLLSPHLYTVPVDWLIVNVIDLLMMAEGQKLCAAHTMAFYPMMVGCGGRTGYSAIANRCWLWVA